MTYASWTAACAKPACHRVAAIHWNIMNEQRIPSAMRVFRDRLGVIFAEKAGTITDSAEAAYAATTDLLEELKNASGKFGGLIVQSWMLLPDLDMITHTTWQRLLRYQYVGRLRTGAPQLPRPKLRRPYMTKPDSSPAGDHIWATFELPDRALGSDPTFVVCALGLDHPPGSIEPAFAGDFLYRFRFRPASTEKAEYCIPTCLDAACNPAWAPPPAHHRQPWGLTRHLVSGELIFPEVLVKTADQIYISNPQFELVSPPGNPVPVGSYTPDFMVGRS